MSITPIFIVICKPFICKLCFDSILFFILFFILIYLSAEYLFIYKIDLVQPLHGFRFHIADFWWSAISRRALIAKIVVNKSLWDPI